MTQRLPISRRFLLKLIGAFTAAPKLFSSTSNSALLARLAVHLPANAVAQQRHYRADASVGLLGVSIASRTGVGAAIISLNNAPGASGASVLLRFSAGSYPERARGFNRLGFIEELVVEDKNEAVESTYFGLITCSNENSLRQARTSIAQNGQEEVPYEASVASAGPSNAAFKKYALSIPSSYSYSQCASLVAKVKETLAASQLRPERAGETTARESYSPRTFLYAVRAAMQAPQQKVSQTFLFNGTQFRLVASKDLDHKAGSQLAAKDLVRSAEGVTRLNGSIENLTDGHKTTFKLWYRVGEDLPVRFEYKAKSFLGLVFEMEPRHLRAHSG